MIDFANITEKLLLNISLTSSSSESTEPEVIWKYPQFVLN